MFPPHPGAAARGERRAAVSPSPGTRGGFAGPVTYLTRLRQVCEQAEGQPLQVYPISRGLSPQGAPASGPRAGPVPLAQPAWRRCPEEIFANPASHFSLLSRFPALFSPSPCSYALSRFPKRLSFDSPLRKAVSLHRCLKWLLISFIHYQMNYA